TGAASAGMGPRGGGFGGPGGLGGARSGGGGFGPPAPAGGGTDKRPDAPTPGGALGGGAAGMRLGGGGAAAGGAGSPGGLGGPGRDGFGGHPPSADPFREAEEALRALRSAPDAEGQRRAADALEAALRKLKGRKSPTGARP